MKITNVFSGRPTYYDRNPTKIINRYLASVAPAGLTVRWTYTVPSGRKAYTENVLCLSSRDTAATTAGETTNFINHQSGANTATLAKTDYTDNTVFPGKYQMVAGSAALMIAGDILNASTNDASTGGSVTHTMSGEVTEFDA